jgi:DnaJ-class molecular chaperone
MAKDPYKILGVQRNASQKEIKAAYRDLAKRYHPDVNPNNAKASEKFNDISAAYELLKDPKKRAQFDRDEIDIHGNPRQQQFYHDFQQGKRQFQDNVDLGDINNFGDIFNALFGRKGTRPGGDQYNTRTVVEYSLEIDFLEAACGTTKRITIAEGKALALTIPEGAEDGQKLRLRGQGPSGQDAIVQLKVRSHPFFERKGNEIHIELPIGIHESILGKKVKIPTIHGVVEAQIPKGSSSGTVLKLKNKGIAGGHQFTKLKLVMPEHIDAELELFIRNWSKINSYNPRKSLKL